MEHDLFILLRCCRVFGISASTTNAYSSASSSSAAPAHTAGRSYLRQARLYYPWLIMLTVGVSCGIGIVRRDYGECYVVSWLVSSIVYIAQTLTHILILLEALGTRAQHADFLWRLHAADLALQLRLRQTSARPLLLRELRRAFWLVASISLVGGCVFAGAITAQHDDGYFWYALASILTMRLRVFQLLVYAQVLRLYLTCLNRRLAQVVAWWSTPGDALMLDVDYTRLEQVALLAAIKETYALLFAAVGDLNDFAGWSLFAIVACYFLDFTCHVYWSLLGLDDLLSPLAYIAAASTLVPLGVIIGKLCWVCEGCKRQSQLTARLLHKVIIQRSQPNFRRYDNLLQNFALQLRHQRIEISGKRFFSFDLQLLMSICAAIATYLVILIQFLKSDRCDRALAKEIIE